jgi:hypothetical protein
MDLDPAEKRHLFRRLLQVCTNTGGAVGAAAGALAGLVTALVTTCYVGAAFYMLFWGVIGGLVGLASGLLTGLVVASETCGFFAPLHDKRRYRWIVTSQFVFVTLTALAFFLRRLGPSASEALPLSWEILVGMLVCLSSWVAGGRVANWYAGYYDWLTAVRAGPIREDDER